jgi:hypothetical protein
VIAQGLPIYVALEPVDMRLGSERLSPEEGGAPISVADFVIKGTRTAVYVDGAAFHRGERLRRDRVIREKLAAGSAGWKVGGALERDV